MNFWPASWKGRLPGKVVIHTLVQPFNGIGNFKQALSFVDFSASDEGTKSANFRDLLLISNADFTGIFTANGQDFSQFFPNIAHQGLVFELGSSTGVSLITSTLTLKNAFSRHIV
ncbi:MAG: hypothetical protein R2875_03405 [Desulfobacterales bacterium]